MISLGAAAFWIALASVLIASGWFKLRREAEKHETLRRMIDKTGTVDEARITELFCAPTPPSGWTNPELWRMPVPPPGQNRKSALVFGTILLSVAAAMAVLFLVLATTGVNTPRQSSIGYAVAAAIAVFGVGMFATAIFTDPPPPKGARDGGGTAP